MLGTILTIVICYIVCIAIYTYIVRNDAMHKYAPDVNIIAIVKDGALGFLIAFAILAAAYYLIGLIRYILV